MLVIEGDEFTPKLAPELKWAKNGNVEAKAIITFFSFGDETSYVEYHQIKDGKLMPGKPCTAKLVRGLAEIAMRARASKGGRTPVSRKGEIPDNLLYIDMKFGEETLVWWRKPQDTGLLTTSEEIVSKLPAMIFMLRGGEMFTYFIKGNRKPKSKTLLYNNFLPNNYSGNKVCWGSGLRPDRMELNEHIEAWEKAYFLSKFTGSVKNDCTDTTHWQYADKTLNDLYK